jgi:hypothetical protein
MNCQTERKSLDRDESARYDSFYDFVLVDQRIGLIARSRQPAHL